MLKKETKAKALCMAMKLEIEEYRSPAYYRLLKKFKTSNNYIYKADLLNFLKSASIMTQRLYFQLLNDLDNETINNINKNSIFKNFCKSFKIKLKNVIKSIKKIIFIQESFEYCMLLSLLYIFISQI